METRMDKCAVCQRPPERMNSTMAECSHVDCPHRRTAWSERPKPERKRAYPENYRRNEADPTPLDKEIDKL
jgi:hypothetical protein